MSRATLRRRAGRLRRRLDELRAPASTQFRWLQVVDDHGAVTFGSGRASWHRQPAGRLQVGADVRVGDHVQVHLGPAGRVVVGDGAVIGSHVIVAADDLVEIGAGSRIGDYSMLADTWTYGTAGGPVAAPPAAPVVIGADATLGLRVVVGPGVHVPDGTSVAAGTMWHQDHQEGPA